MPPKAKAGAPAGKSPVKSSWESDLVQANYVEAGFSSQVHLILGEDQEASIATQQRLKKAIGSRQRFSLISAQQATEFVTDKKNKGQGTFSEVIDVCKGVDGAEITDVTQLQPAVLAKLVKVLLLRDKESDLARRNVRPPTADEGKGKGKDGKKSPKGGKGKDTATPDGDEKKQWSTLKKRGEKDSDDESNKFLDDEPEDGPDHYVLLVGFDDPCLPLLLAGAGVELTSIIQIRSETEAAKPHPFWDDLATIFRRGEDAQKLLDTTRWQLTYFEEDEDGSQLYDEIAALAFDLTDKFKAFQSFDDRLDVIPVPVADLEQQEKLMQRYESKTKDIPLVGQSINVLVHSMRESVSDSVATTVENIEEVPTKVGNTALNNAINSALASFNLTDEEMDDLKDIYSPPVHTSVTTSPILNQCDQVGLRLSRLDHPKKLEEVEKEMIALHPVNELFNIEDTEVRREAQSFLTDVDHHLWSAGVYSDSQIRQTLLLMSAGQVKRSKVTDESGAIQSPTEESFIPWDIPSQLAELDKTSLIDEGANDTCYERFDRSVAVQRLMETHEDSTAVEVVQLNRDDGVILVFHNPVGDGANKNQNFEGWSEKVISKCRFRHWVEHIEPMVEEWLDEWEKQKQQQLIQRQREQQAQMEAARVASATLLSENETHSPAAFIVPGSLKAQSRDQIAQASLPKLDKKKSSRKSLKKDSRPDSKKKSSRSSSKTSVVHKSSTPTLAPEATEEFVDPFPKYQSYDLNNNVFAAGGQQRRIYTSDNGYVTVKQSSFSDTADDLTIKIRQMGNTVNFHQQKPRNVPKVEALERPQSSSSSRTDGSASSTGSVVEQVPPSSFSSISAVLSDGIALSYSICGETGRPSNADAELNTENRRFRHFLIPEECTTPSRDPKSPKGDNGKKASGPKAKKEKSSENIEREAETPEPEQQLRQETQPQIQQLYMSTPDGTLLRFGVDDGKIFIKIIRPHEKEVTRLIKADMVCREYSTHECETLHFDGSMTYTSPDSTEQVLKRDGTSDDGKKLLAYTCTDPTTNDRMFVRSDGLTIVVRSTDEIIQYPDGTRVTKSDNDLQVEKPGWPCILFEESATKCMVVLANGTYIQVTSAGAYQLSHQTGAYLTLSEDGTFVFSAASENVATHIIRQQEVTALEMIEPDGLTTIQVSNIGKTAVIHNMAQEEENKEESAGYLPKERVFYIRNKEEVLEFLNQEEARKDIDTVHDDPMSAALFQQVPEAPNEKAVTLLSPMMRSSTWSVHTYQEESLVPPYLRQSDLRKCGAGDTRNGHLQSDDSRMTPQSPILRMRSIVINDPITTEMKSFVLEKLKQVAQERSLLTHDDVKSNVGIVVHRERSDLLERFLNLASQADTATLRAQWTHETRTPTPLPSQVKKTNLTKEDWQKIRDEKAEFKKNLVALKDKKIPNYWESQDGQTFLKNLADNQAIQAAADLPRAPPVSPPPETNPSTPLPPLEKRKPPVVLPREMSKGELVQQQVEMEKIVGYRHPFGIWGYRCDFHPVSVDFGDLIEGQTYLRVVHLQNSGFSKLSFKVRAPGHSGLTAKYKIGPLAPGLSARIELQFTATGGVLREDGIYDFIDQLVIEKPVGEAKGVPQLEDTISLPIAARIIPLSELERLKKMDKPTEQLSKSVLKK